jgi:hypothetical protein
MKCLARRRFSPAGLPISRPLVIVRVQTDDFTWRQIAAIIGGFIVAAAVVVVLVGYVANTLFPHDPNDPLTKAGGLKAE